MSPDRGARITQAERAFLAALHVQLAADEILLTGIRITDPREGDVEVDAMVLFPDLGAAVIEIKGGLVQYANGEWTTSRGTYRRRIHPVQQARKAKHALRRYLDRQPDWHGPLLRTEWFLALPHTAVHGDFGPEGLRDHIIGQQDLTEIRTRIRRVLESTLNADVRPHQGWEQDVLALLMRDGRADTRSGRLSRGKILLAAVLATCLGALSVWLMAVRGQANPVPVRTEPMTSQCAPGYSPCLPVVTDLDCDDIRQPVRVTGEDIYDLDRDGDGYACEVFGR